MKVWPSTVRESLQRILTRAERCVLASSDMLTQGGDEGALETIELRRCVQALKAEMAALLTLLE